MSRIGHLFILCALAGITFSSYSFAQQGGPKGPTAIIASPVVMGGFADEVEALGTIKSNESVVITADRAEKITAIHFEDGQQVNQGDLLITLDKNQEEAQLRASEAVTAETQTSYERAKGLSGNSALPKATVQERLAELKQAQADTEALKAGLQSYEITAPFSGVLGLREVSVGSLVQPGDMITTIDDLSQVKVDFDVPSIFLETLKPGLPVTGHVDAYGERAFEGTVSTINTQIDPVTRTVRVRALIPNEDGLLKPGLLMSITLRKNPRQALLIPEESLLKRSDKNFVYVVTQSEGKMIAKQTEIALGARKPGTIEVLSGLSEGDQVVVHGTVKLSDGAEISIRAVENEDAPLDELLKQTPANADKES